MKNTVHTYMVCFLIVGMVLFTVWSGLVCFWSGLVYVVSGGPVDLLVWSCLCVA